MNRARNRTVSRKVCLLAFLSVLLLASVLPLAGGRNPPEPPSSTEATRAGSWTFSGNQVSSLDGVADRRVMEPIIIQDSATLYINNSLVNVTQDFPNQLSIVVRDSGRLHLSDGIITSNTTIRLYLNDSATLLLEKGSELRIAELNVNGERTLLALNDSSLHVGNISIDRIGKLILNGVGGTDGITGLNVVECEDELLIVRSEITDMIVDRAHNITITNSEIEGDTWFHRSTGSLELSNSTVRGMNVQSARELAARGSSLLDMVVVSCSGSSEEPYVRFFNCTVNDVVLDVSKGLHLRGGTVAPSSKGYMDNLCSADRFRAEEGTVFTYMLTFAGETDAYLANITTPGIEARDRARVELHNWHEKTRTSPIFSTPSLSADGGGEIFLYRTLTVTVKDLDGMPADGAEVRVLEDIGNVTLYSGKADGNGMVLMDVLTSIITRSDEDFRGYYRTEAAYTENRKRTTSTNTTTMTGRLTIVLVLDTVVGSGGEKDEGVSIWLWSGILLLVIILAMGVLALRSRMRK